MSRCSPNAADIIHLEVLRRDSDAVDSVLKQTGTKLLLTPKQERLKKFLEQNDARSVKNIVDAGWQDDKVCLHLLLQRRQCSGLGFENSGGASSCKHQRTDSLSSSQPSRSRQTNAA
eukprot:842799-Rhodomonas_salina.2